MHFFSQDNVDVMTAILRRRVRKKGARVSLLCECVCAAYHTRTLTAEGKISPQLNRLHS